MDPFIYHAVRAWLEPVQNSYHNQILEMIRHPKTCARLVEACVANHYRRFFPTYYIKGDGEVDVAYIKDKRFWPVEIKWTERLSISELKQIRKYPNGLILTKQTSEGEILQIPTQPIPLALLSLG